MSNNTDEKINDTTPPENLETPAICSPHLNEDDFRRELSELLGRYNAEIVASNYYEGYAECGEEIKMVVDVPTVYDTSSDILRSGFKVDLGNIVYPPENVTV